MPPTKRRPGRDDPSNPYTSRRLDPTWQAWPVTEIDQEKPLDLRVHLGRFWMDPHKVIYGTIMLMVAYALFDEGKNPFNRASLFELIGLSIAPLFALAMAHAFSEALDFQISHARRLTWHDRRRLFLENAKYLLIAVPPVVVMIVLALMRMDANDIIGIVQILGLLSLSFWGAYAARTAGLSRGRQFTYAVSYGFMGLIVIGVELAITH